MDHFIPVLESIRTILSQEDFVSCITWADRQGYPIATKYSADIGKKKAESIIEDWREAKDSKASAWREGIPSLRVSSMTVKNLHAYLSNILTSHPESANTVIHHVELGQPTNSTSIEFDKGTNTLCIS